MRQLLAKTLQQKDNLCGPFWAARVLQEAGFSEWDGQAIDEDLVALRAGTTLPPAGGTPSVPPGAASLTDYRFDLPTASVEESGTSAAGLVHAIEAASAGALIGIPVRGRWTANRIEQLVSEAPRLGARLIANVRTGKLRDQPAGWDVGHFIELVMLIREPGGSLVVVQDSYPTLGVQGRHLQPPRALAAALLRGDGRKGGVLVIAVREKANALAALANGLGLDIGTWNNGSRSADHGDR